MARKPRRRFRPYLRGQVDELQDLTTLAAQTGVKNAIDDTVTENTWCSSVELTWSLQEYQPADNAGPIIVGIAHSDYTLTEIEEYLESLGSWEVQDLRTQEIAKRKIRRVGVFPTVVATDDFGATVLNDGKPIRTKCNWMLHTGQTIALWYYNAGTDALAGPPAPRVHTTGHANLWPA